MGRYNARVTLASISRALILLIVTQSESYNSCPCSADEQTEATEANQLTRDLTVRKRQSHCKENWFRTPCS